jgi:dienelactone hydrolase
MRLRGGLAAASAFVLLLAASPCAGLSLTDPWPAPDQVSGQGGTPVTFSSHSPFVPADVGGGADVDPPTDVGGLLFMPEGASAASPVPAVVMLHGSSGVQDSREGLYGRQLAAMGVAALVVDSFGSRRDRATQFIDRLIEITETMLIADAYAALEYLAQRGDVDPRRVVLVGFSYGGMAAVYAAYAQIAGALAPQGQRFAGHVGFYAPCIARFDEPRTTGAPVLLLYGGRDAVTDPERCGEIIEDLRAGGSAVETFTYQEAVHQWDGGIMQERTIGRDLTPCRFAVEPDGTVRDRISWLAMVGPLTRKAILGLCVENEPYLIGRNDAVRARSNRDLGRFLTRAFGS